MDINKRMIFAITSGCIILIISIIIAYISFSILESSAEANLKNWKLGGAFAAFVFTASLLTSIIFQFYKQLTSDKVQEYQQQIQELQSKVVKGAPCPADYIIDLDEKHKIVFARPIDWQPKGGILYQYFKKDPSDIFHTNFNILYYDKNELVDLCKRLGLGRFDITQASVDKLYDAYSKDEFESVIKAFNGENENITKEYVFIDSLKSIKYTMTYTFNGENKKFRLCQTGVLTFVPRLCALFSFTFSEREEIYTKSSEVFNNVITSIRFL